MRAGIGAGCALHIPQKSVHFFGFQSAPCPDTAVASHAGQNGIQPIGETVRIASVQIRIIGQFIGDISQETVNILRAQKGWYGAQKNTARPEGLKIHSQSGQVFSAYQKSFRLAPWKIDDFRQKQRLRAERPTGILFTQALMREALVGGVLVNENEVTIRSDSNDVGIENLRD